MGTPGCFRKSILFLFIHIKPAGWRHVRGVGGCVTGESRAQVCFAEEKQIKNTHARDYFT